MRSLGWRLKVVHPTTSGNEKAGNLCSPPAVPVFVFETVLVDQRTPGAAGKRIISVSVIDIEVIVLVMPVGALSAIAFMLLTIAPRCHERNSLCCFDARRGERVCPPGVLPPHSSFRVASPSTQPLQMRHCAGFNRFHGGEDDPEAVNVVGGRRFRRNSRLNRAGKHLDQTLQPSLVERVITRIVEV